MQIFFKVFFLLNSTSDIDLVLT